MSKPIIEVENLSKCYRIGANKEPYLSLRDEVAKTVRRASSALSGMFSRNHHQVSSSEQDFWALNDVSFSVQEGEAVGIIGRNGAGKSTLLKILSQITPPTKGHIAMRGRVASLLEVGTGFHPELTGRENIFLNGAILGMSREEIRRKFDEIVAFADVEKFLDTPVKRYSSGMYVRLAFAVAAHLEPEILIVDEVLAVGDTEFQKKCIGKMGEVTKGGRTVLFVSHNLSAVNSLCNRGLLLSKGKSIIYGDTQEVLAQYTQGTLEQGGHVILRPDPVVAKENEIAAITKISLHNASGQVSDAFFIGNSLTICFELIFFKHVSDFQVSFIVKSSLGNNIYHCVSRDSCPLFTDGLGRVSISATFPTNSLYPGTYIIDELWIATGKGMQLDLEKDCISFHVPEGGPSVHRRLAKQFAIVHEVPNWSCAHI
jgi:lipopolysaccharide transport system ATP-binding protein